MLRDPGVPQADRDMARAPVLPGSSLPLAPALFLGWEEQIQQALLALAGFTGSSQSIPPHPRAAAGGSFKGRPNIAKIAAILRLHPPALAQRAAASARPRARACCVQAQRASCGELPAAEQKCGSGDCRWQSHLVSGREAGAPAAGSAQGQRAGEGALLPGSPPEPTHSLAPRRGEQLSSGRLLHACCALTKSQCYFLSRE